MTRSCRSAGLARLPCLAAAPAPAADGAIEINQARALAGGISPGDGAGFPVTLSARGKYRLTGNLEVPGGTGILVTATNVTLDLNGFSIVCSDAPACAASPPAPPSTGIEATPNNLQNTTVRDGMVRGFRRGISLAHYSLVEDITATANLEIAISVGVASTVRDCNVTGNAFLGILVLGGSLVAGNVVADNAGHAICTTSDVRSSYRDNVLLQSNTVCTNTLVNAGGNVCGAGLCP